MHSYVEWRRFYTFNRQFADACDCDENIVNRPDVRRYMQMQDMFDAVCSRSAVEARRRLDEPCENLFHLIRNRIVVEQNGCGVLLLYPEPRLDWRMCGGDDSSSSVEQITVPREMLTRLRQSWVMYNLDLIVEYNVLAGVCSAKIADYVRRHAAVCVA